MDASAGAGGRTVCARRRARGRSDALARVGLGLLLLATAAGCAPAGLDDGEAGAAGAASRATSTTWSPATTSTTPTTSSTTTSTTSTSTTTSTTSTSTTSTTTTVAPSPTWPADAPVDLPALAAATAQLAAEPGNLVVSVSVWQDGVPIFRRAHGRRLDGEPATTGTPLVQASVSKLVTALTIARLVEAGVLRLGDVPPWSEMGIAHDRAWDTVTVRELMSHRSGMPIAPDAWFDERGSCRTPLTYLMGAPPEATRGRWHYSNGNYCALGLLVEHLTGTGYDEAARRLVLGPAGVTEPHITPTGLRPTDAPYRKGVERLDRLGAAGQWLLSTDDVAAMLSTVTVDDLRVLSGPGIFYDPYGWGHTGTVDGAKSCAWTLDHGHVVIVGTVSGDVPWRGSLVCDRLVPALAADLGLRPLLTDADPGDVPPEWRPDRFAPLRDR